MDITNDADLIADINREILESNLSDHVKKFCVFMIAQMFVEFEKRRTS